MWPWSDVDFLDIVVSVFGLIILIALLATHFLGLPETVLTRSLQEWFFAILGFIIGKKGFLPSGRSNCVGCVNYATRLPCDSAKESPPSSP